MTKKLHKFWRLPASEKRLLLRAGVVVVLMRLALSALPFRVLRARILNKDLHRVDEASGDLPERVAWAVSRVSRFVPAASCLTQALATRWLLGRSGIDCTVRLGVQRDAGGAFRAHAWVEHAGRVVIGDQGSLSSFAPLPAL